jgi:hypothetical protein
LLPDRVDMASVPVQPELDREIRGPRNVTHVTLSTTGDTEPVHVLWSLSPVRSLSARD